MHNRKDAADHCCANWGKKNFSRQKCLSPVVYLLCKKSSPVYSAQRDTPLYFKPNWLYVQRLFSSWAYLLFSVIYRLSLLTPAQTHRSSRFLFLETSASSLLNLEDQQIKEIQVCAFVVCNINYDIIIQCAKPTWLNNRRLYSGATSSHWRDLKEK